MLRLLQHPHNTPFFTIALQAVMDKVRADKLREVLDGHDGTWVAHPGLIPIAKEVRWCGLSSCRVGAGERCTRAVYCTTSTQLGFARSLSHSV